MSFTDRFICLPIKVYNVKNKEMGLPIVYEDEIMRITPFEIVAYKPVTEMLDGKELRYVHVMQRNGEAFYCYLTLSEFEKRLNDHFEKLNNGNADS